MKQRFFFWILPALSVLVSCGSNKKLAQRQKAFETSYCMPVMPYRDALVVDTSQAQDKQLRDAGLGPHDVIMCKATMISGAVGELFRIGADTSLKTENRRLLLKQRIQENLLMAQAQMDAIAAELDCEGERTDLASHYVDDRNNKRNTGYAVAAVLVGAVTTLATAVIRDDKADVAVGVAGGLTGAVLSALTINPKGKKVLFRHERNLLKWIWYDTQPSDCPAFIYYLLHRPELSNSGTIALTESMKQRWQRYELDGGTNLDQLMLLFGEGGLYTSDDLHTRADMINQMQSTIRSLHQDMSSLRATLLQH